MQNVSTGHGSFVCRTVRLTFAAAVAAAAVGIASVAAAPPRLTLAVDASEAPRGILHARLGNMRASVSALEEFIRRAPEGMARHQAAAFLQQLKSKLN